MGTHYRVVDSNEIELDDEEPTRNESWNNSAARGGHGIGTTMMQSWYVLPPAGRTGSFQNAQQGPSVLDLLVWMCKALWSLSSR